MNALDLLLIVAGVGFILVRRMLGEVVELRKMLILPVVLTAIGAGQLGHVSGTAAAFLTVSVVLSLGLGALRGATVHLEARGGRLWMRYRVSTVALWVANLAGKGVLLAVAHAVAPHSGGGSEGVMVALGLGILAETLVIGARALRTDATVVWQQGKDGRPDTTSAQFEQLRSWVRTQRR